jgi:hypothetical protein
MMNLSTWDRRRWMALSALLVIVIAALLIAWPRNTVPDHVTIRVVDSSQGKVYSTQVVPLR